MNLRNRRYFSRSSHAGAALTAAGLLAGLSAGWATTVQAGLPVNNPTGTNYRYDQNFEIERDVEKMARVTVARHLPGLSVYVPNSPDVDCVLSRLQGTDEDANGPQEIGINDGHPDVVQNSKDMTQFVLSQSNDEVKCAYTGYRPSELVKVIYHLHRTPLTLSDVGGTLPNRLMALQQRLAASPIVDSETIAQVVDTGIDHTIRTTERVSAKSRMGLLVEVKAGDSLTIDNIMGQISYDQGLFKKKISGIGIDGYDRSRLDSSITKNIALDMNNPFGLFCGFYLGDAASMRARDGGPTQGLVSSLTVSTWASRGGKLQYHAFQSGVVRCFVNGVVGDYASLEGTLSMNVLHLQRDVLQEQVKQALSDQEALRQKEEVAQGERDSALLESSIRSWALDSKNSFYRNQALARMIKRLRQDRDSTLEEVRIMQGVIADLNAEMAATQNDLSLEVNEKEKRISEIQVSLDGKQTELSAAQAKVAQLDARQKELETRIEQIIQSNRRESEARERAYGESLRAAEAARIAQVGAERARREAAVTEVIFPRIQEVAYTPKATRLILSRTARDGVNAYKKATRYTNFQIQALEVYSGKSQGMNELVMTAKSQPSLTQFDSLELFDRVKDRSPIVLEVCQADLAKVTKQLERALTYVAKKRDPRGWNLSARFKALARQYKSCTRLEDVAPMVATFERGTAYQYCNRGEVGLTIENVYTYGVEDGGEATLKQVMSTKSEYASQLKFFQEPTTIAVGACEERTNLEFVD